MKASILLGAAVILAAACSAQATIVVDDNLSGGTIPDGNPAGFATADAVNGVTDVGAIDYVTVSLNISGGYNGDLYGYLVYQPSGGGSTTMSVLLNRPGLGSGSGAQQLFGYSTSGMNVTLDDRVIGANINSTQNPISGHSYNSAGNGLASTFNGVSTVNGTWTLALFDMSAGGGTSVLNGWSLAVDEVPEPVTWALIIFGAATGTLFVMRVRA
jgi:hypothetical protein